MKQYLLKVWMTAALSLLVVGGVWGQAAPTVVSWSPADDGTEVSLDGVLSVTFDQNIEFGSGPSYIRIKDYVTDDSVIECVVMDSKAFGNVSISGSTLSIAHSALSGSTRYYVEIEANAIRALNSGLSYAGLGDKDIWDFTTETLPISPMVSALLPLAGATGVSLTDDLVITFDQDIRFGLEGFWWIRIKEYNSDNTFQSFIVSGEDTNDKLSISNNQLVISHNQFAEGVRYYVTIDADAIESLQGVGIGGLSSKDEWDFTTETLPIGPMVSALLPLDGATGVSLTDALVITFDQAIRFGSEETWYIRIIEYNSDKTFQSFNVSGEDTNDKLSISNNQLVISHNQFAEGVRYSVTIDADAIESLQGVGIGGLSSKDEWDFTTETLPIGPMVSALLPLYGATGVSLTDDLVITFDQDIRFGLEGFWWIRIKEYNSDNTFQSFIVSGEDTNENLSIFNNQLVISHNQFAEGVRYYVTIGADAIESLEGVGIGGLSSKD